MGHLDESEALGQQSVIITPGIPIKYSSNMMAYNLKLDSEKAAINHVSRQRGVVPYEYAWQSSSTAHSFDAQYVL